MSTTVEEESSSSNHHHHQKKSIVIVGGGIQGTSIAYQIYKRSLSDRNIISTIYILEAKEVASAASGKGGGFMAKTWGDGDTTQQLHHLSFDMYEELAKEIGCISYRKLPVLSVAPGRNNNAIQQAKKKKFLDAILPSWLDGNTGRINIMGDGNDTAQITPKEFVHKMIEKMTTTATTNPKTPSSDGCEVKVVLGECIGVETTKTTTSDEKVIITGVKYIDRTTKEQCILKADSVVISCGPWSCQAEDWFHDYSGGGIELPMEGVKSTSIVWKPPPPPSQDSGRSKDNNVVVDATALFCGEDSRYSTHLEVYPRPDNTIYICGIGGSDYIKHDELKLGKYREICDAKQTRVTAATKSFQEISATYQQDGYELDKVQSCMRPCPPDAKPYMGKIPGYEGAYINAGHNCWGIAWAPACGKAMAELILDGSSSCIDLSPFDPTRFSPKLRRNEKDGDGTGRGRKRQGQSVGEQW